MTIQVGEKIPSLTLSTMTSEGPKPIVLDELCAGKKVVLFAVPGAFTPTCSAQHLPGYVNNAAALKEKGVDIIACISVNDPFVPNGIVIAVLDVHKIKKWTLEDADLACSEWEAGWFAWELTHIRKVTHLLKAPARRKIYEISYSIGTLLLGAP